MSTPDGCSSHDEYSITTGGTGTAISLASLNNIPVFNLKNPNHIRDIEMLISQLGSVNND